MSRKTALTPQVEERILGLLKLGNYVEVACRSAGIHKDTFYDWMKRGRTNEEPFASFSERVGEAVADAEAMDLATIKAASKDTWQAAAWRLERRFPERWGRKDRVDAETVNRLQKPQRIEITLTEPGKPAEEPPPEAQSEEPNE